MENQKTTLITGATSGIGLAAAAEFAKRGMKVFAVGRNAQRCESARQSILNQAPSADVEFILCDLSRQAEIRTLCKAITQKTTVLDAIVHGAGLITNRYAETADGLEMQFALNHMAPFLLTRGLMSSLSRSADARVVLITSVARRFARLNWNDLQMSRRYFGLAQYGRTKLCNVLYALEFNRRYRDTCVKAVAFDPGIVRTGIGSRSMSGVMKAACRFVIGRGSDVNKTARELYSLIDLQEISHSLAVHCEGVSTKAANPAARYMKAAERLWHASERLLH